MVTRTISWTWILLFLSVPLFAQQFTNHALIIGVDSYKVLSSPSQLATNIDSVISYVNQSPFHFQTNILRNDAVSPAAVKEAFRKLSLKEGDHVFIYMTGHGEQVKDLNGDEKDHYDEAFVCHDASLSDAKADHSNILLLDDELDLLLTDLRERAGTSGQVFMVVECCHSATINKNGHELPFRDYSREWQAAFLSEKVEAAVSKAPLIVFSSSRASNETATASNYTQRFLTTLSKFQSGCYADLFYQFYLQQRRNELNYSVAEQTVNVYADYADYLRLGLFTDSVYPYREPISVINVDEGYPVAPVLEINKGLYQGLTNGSVVEISTGGQQVWKAKVSQVQSSTAWVQLDAGVAAPEREELWDADVKVAYYNFEDTLFLAIDKNLPKKLSNDISGIVKNASFAKIKVDTANGYTFSYVDGKGLFLRRNKDGKALFPVTDIQAAILKLQISRFIRQVRSTAANGITLKVIRQKDTLTERQMSLLRTGDQLYLYVHPEQLKSSMFYCLLQMEDEFIKQLVPVNFQINDGECKLSAGELSDILIGEVKVGSLDGQFTLIASENPIDLREVLFEPVNTKSRGLVQHNFNDIESLVNTLFLNRNGQQSLYNPDQIQVHNLVYRISQ